VFTASGAGHCAGATGAPVWIDAIGTLQTWVEQGTAPDRIIATKYANEDPTKALQRTGPLCPWPKAAVYGGSGSTDDAANFS
jgi:feruloyl esterase